MELGELSASWSYWRECVTMTYQSHNVWNHKNNEEKAAKKNRTKHLTINIYLWPQMLQSLLTPPSKEIKIRYDFLHLPFNHSDTFQFIREQLKYMALVSPPCLKKTLHINGVSILQQRNLTENKSILQTAPAHCWCRESMCCLGQIELI